MANIPVIGEGSATEHPLPAVPEPMPPRSAFPGQVGASVEALGVEVGRIAYEERQKANEVRALQAETDYQDFVNKTVYDAQSGYSSLHGEQALSQSEEVKDKISQERVRLSTALNSRYAQHLFLNNSQRILRFAQNHVDAYAGQQRKVIDDTAYRNFLGTSAQTLGTLAAAKGGYDQQAADDALEVIQKRAYERASRLGFSQEAADDFAQKSLSVGVDALLGTLAKTGNAKAQEEYGRWGDYLSANKRVSVETALASHAGKEEAAKIIYGAPRLNFSRKGEPDRDGMIDERAVYAEVQKVPEERRAQVGKMVDQLMAEEAKNFDRAVQVRVGQVMADGKTVDGTFQMDRQKSSDEIEWLKRNAPGGPGRKPGLRELEMLEKRDERQGEKRDNETSLKLLRSRLVQRLAQDPEGLKKMTPVDLQNEMLGDEYPGFTSSGMRQGQALLKSFQSDPKIQLLERVPKHVDEFLDGTFGKGDVDLKKRYHDELISEVSEAMTASGKEKWDDVGISQFIHRAFDKKAGTGGFLSSDKYLIDLRIEARKQQGGGRLPIRVQRNKGTGEVRVIYGTD